MLSNMDVSKYFLCRNGKWVYLALVFLSCAFFDFKIDFISNFFHDYIPLYAYLSSWTGREAKIFVWLFFSIAFFPIAFVDLFFEPLRHEDFLENPLRQLILFSILLIFTSFLFALDLNVDEAVGRAGRRFRDIKRIGLGFYIYMPMFSFTYSLMVSYAVSLFYFYFTFLFNIKRWSP